MEEMCTWKKHISRIVKNPPWIPMTDLVVENHNLSAENFSEDDLDFLTPFK